MVHYLKFKFYIGKLAYQLLLEQELAVRRGLRFALSFQEVILERDSTKITKKTPFVQVNFSQSPENRDIHVYYYRPLLILEKMQASVSTRIGRLRHFSNNQQSTIFLPLFSSMHCLDNLQVSKSLFTFALKINTQLRNKKYITKQEETKQERSYIYI